MHVDQISAKKQHQSSFFREFPIIGSYRLPPHRHGAQTTTLPLSHLNLRVMLHHSRYD